MSGERDDGFEFLPDDDELDQEAAIDDVGPEVGALHIVDGDELASHDPGRSDVATSDEDADGGEVAYFDDEEPETGGPAPAADDETNDVEDVLIRQHYAFDADETDDGDGGDADQTDAPPAARWRRRLTQERARVSHLRDQLVADANEAEEAGELAAVDQHQADAASTTYEIEQVKGQIEDLEAELVEIEAAFARIDAGTYGRCEVCDQPISPERLAAVPLTRRCIRHG